MACVDKFLVNNLDGDYLYELHHVNGKWEVFCWKVELVPGATDFETPYASIEHVWDLDRKTIGHRDGNPNLLITEPFTEETAREEFERWRR